MKDAEPQKKDEQPEKSTSVGEILADSGDFFHAIATRRPPR
jgi:hypothetical protein